MSEHLISREDAERDLLACAAFLGETIQSNDGRADAMTEVVPRFLSRGDVDLAAELANTVDDPFVRDRLLIAVAVKCASIDDDEYALQLVEAMDDPGMKAQARERIGAAFAAKGNIEMAYSVAEEMAHRDNVLAGIALRRQADQALDDAVATLDEMEFPSTAARTLVTMAAASIESGNAEQAAELLERSLAPAEETEHEDERVRVLTDIANSFIAAGRNDRAIETFEKARTHADALGNVQRDNSLAAISLGFLRAGSLDLADRALDSVKDKTQIATTLLGFAREFWRRDEKTEALEALDESYSILKSQRDSETRDSKARFVRYADIAVQFAGFEKGERAIEIAHEIIDEELSMKALAQTAQILYVQQNDELSRQALTAIPDDAQRMFALIGLSDTAAAGGDQAKAIELLDEARQLAEEVPQLASRSSAHVEIARRFAKFGEETGFSDEVGRSLATIIAIRDESVQTKALAELSELADEPGVTVPEETRDALRAIVARSLQQNF